MENMRGAFVAILVFAQLVGAYYAIGELPFEPSGDPNMGSVADGLGQLLIGFVVLVQICAGILLLFLTRLFERRFRMLFAIVSIASVIPAAIYLVQSV